MEKNCLGIGHDSLRENISSTGFEFWKPLKKGFVILDSGLPPLDGLPYGAAMTCGSFSDLPNQEKNIS